MFYYDLYDQSDEFNVIGQQVSYYRRPRATCHILHWMPQASPEGIILLQCNIWHVALWLGNN